MSRGVAVAAAATAIAAAFAVALARRYLRRGRVNRSLLHWSAALAMFAVATLALALGEAAGWTSGLFRVFYLFGATLTVPWLAMGTVHTSSRDRVTLRVLGVASLLVAALLAVPLFVADEPALFAPAVVLAVIWGVLLASSRPDAAAAASLLIVATFTAVAAFSVAAAPLRAAVPPEGLPEGRVLFPLAVRGLAFAGNVVGSTLVIVGAVTAAVRLRGRGAPHLVVGNLLIGVGVLIAASGGTFAFLGATEDHAIAFAVGAAVMYAGFVRTTRAPGGSPTHPTVVVEVFTREDCGLCDDAEALAAAEAGAEGAELRLVDVDEDPDLRERYGERVPVVVVAGREVGWGRIEPGAVRQAVREARR